MLLAFFCNKQSEKEAEILQEGFSLIFFRVKLLPDSNSFFSTFHPHQYII